MVLVSQITQGGHSGFCLICRQRGQWSEIVFIMTDVWKQLVWILSRIFAEWFVTHIGIFTRGKINVVAELPSPHNYMKHKNHLIETKVSRTMNIKAHFWTFVTSVTDAHLRLWMRCYYSMAQQSRTSSCALLSSASYLPQSTSPSQLFHPWIVSSIPVSQALSALHWRQAMPTGHRPQTTHSCLVLQNWLLVTQTTEAPLHPCQVHCGCSTPLWLAQHFPWCTLLHLCSPQSPLASAPLTSPPLRWTAQSSLLKHPPDSSSLSLQQQTLWESLCQPIFTQLHQLVHLSVCGSQNLIGNRYFWLHMWRYVTLWIWLCTACPAVKIHQHIHTRLYTVDWTRCQTRNHAPSHDCLPPAVEWLGRAIPLLPQNCSPSQPLLSWLPWVLLSSDHAQA